MNLIILTEEDKISENLYRITGNRYLHVKNILKLNSGDGLKVGLINGPKADAVIKEIHENEIILLLSKYYSIEIIKNKLDVICALPRPQTLKKVLHISAAMGVNHLYLIRSNKVEKSYFHSPLLEEENLRNYLIEGLSQAKRTDLPIVSVHLRFKEFFAKHFTAKNSVCLLANPSSGNYLSDSGVLKSNNVIIAIGPEAGWNEFEVNFMTKMGFNNFKISNNILRVEHAIIAILAQIELIIYSRSV